VSHIFQTNPAGGVAGGVDPGKHVPPAGSPGLSEPSHIKDQESESKGTFASLSLSLSLLPSS